MTYSSALFGGDERRSLADAQRAKNARLLQEISVAPGARVLEIGCGWGGFAETAARAGLEIHGLTLSTEQLAYANARLQRAGLAQRGRLRLQDYRDEQGQYDAIVSVEMFEAVGEAYWPAYFQTLRRCLKPGGRAAIQTITIADAYFERYRRGTDFIQQYVFPGGMLPSPSRFEALAHAAGLTVVKRFAFGRDYARTLALWREVFMSKLPQVREQGFDQRFIRIWEFYLAYCEAAFRHDSTDVYQYTLQLPA
jgi:cyclopropane-fatty-acyl-phospholipid synthase